MSDLIRKYFLIISFLTVNQKCAVLNNQLIKNTNETIEKFAIMTYEKGVVLNGECAALNDAS